VSFGAVTESRNLAAAFLYVVQSGSLGVESLEPPPINSDSTLGSTPSGGPLNVTQEPEIFLHYTGVNPITY
jgi:hypothetical protein